MEEKFIAYSARVQEAVWLRQFLENLGIQDQCKGPVTINCDSQAAIAFTKDHKYHSRTKHIYVKYNFVRGIIAQEKVRVQYISTHNMIDDPLTKPIARDVFVGHVRSLGLPRI